jgi:hypothetical protein
MGELHCNLNSWNPMQGLHNQGSHADSHFDEGASLGGSHSVTIQACHHKNQTKKGQTLLWFSGQVGALLQHYYPWPGPEMWGRGLEKHDGCALRDLQREVVFKLFSQFLVYGAEIHVSWCREPIQPLPQGPGAALFCVLTAS